MSEVTVNESLNDWIKEKLLKNIIWGKSNDIYQPSKYCVFYYNNE